MAGWNAISIEAIPRKDKGFHIWPSFEIRCKIQAYFWRNGTQPASKGQQWWTLVVTGTKPY